MGFLAMYLIFGWDWAVYVSLGVGVLGIMSGWISRKIEWAWMQLAKVLGYIMPNILLSIVFFLFLFPIALLQRIFKKDPLMLRNRDQTYFIEVNKEMGKAEFEKIW